jgi:RNA polymerase primary sigma factor
MDEFGLREQLNGIQQLLDQAEEQGYLTADQILDAFPAGEDGAAALTAQLDDLFVTLYDQGIEVYGNEEQARDERVQLEEEPGSDVDRRYGAAPDLSDIPVADAVGLYFREMSHVPLLTHEEEVALAKRLERGRKARRQLARNGHDPQERSRLKHLIQQGEEAR